MVLPYGKGPHSPPTPSPNQCGRGVLDVLSRVGTTTSELSKPPVGLKYYLHWYVVVLTHELNQVY